jgi:hypothetical protein
MNKSEKLLLALGTIALGAVVPATSASAQQQDAATCEWLSQRSPNELRQFLRDNPNDSCVEVAARMLVERTQPAQSGSRY